MPNPIIAVEVDNLFKSFSHKKTRISIFELLRTALNKNFNNRVFYALKDINIKIFKGDKIGLIGDNGSGKTTLLKILAGLYKPTSGKVFVEGDVCLLSGLGVGMLDDLSVEENIYLNGMIYGLEKRVIRENLNEILQWAELTDFSGEKLKNLSTGMRTRLAFSTFRYIKADIFLVDEALSAGDINFRKKCEIVFEEMKKSNDTYLVSSHDMKFIRKFCTKSLWLQKGRQLIFDSTDKVLEKYDTTES